MFSKCTPLVKYLASIGTIITALALIVGVAAAAGDTRWVTVVAQNASEQRELQRDIKKLEIEEEQGTATPADKAYKQFLELQLQELKSIDG